jgi:hypothetical protein
MPWLQRDRTVRHHLSLSLSLSSSCRQYSFARIQSILLPSILAQYNKMNTKIIKRKYRANKEKRKTKAKKETVRQEEANSAEDIRSG